jgi:hypothetical protein
MKGSPYIDKYGLSWDDRYHRFAAVVHFPLLRRAFIQEMLETREGRRWLADFVQAGQAALAERDCR